MDQLEQARQMIDDVDAKMAELFERRMEAVAQVIRYKREHGMPILDSGREKQVIEKNTARLSRQELKPYFEDFLKAEMALSRQYQAAVLGRDTVAYQGVEGAFTHIALMHLFPRGRALACASWSEVFAAVEEGRAAHGVLPFENSHAGDVSDVLDLCYAHRDLYVVDVYDLPVSQNLLVLPGTKLSEITDVYSHPQAIRQSEKFLKSVGLPCHSWGNTATAAKYVAETGDRTKAAIASPETARLYGLEVLVPNINTDGDNTTRFIVIGREKPVDGNRFSLLFTVDNKPGTLAGLIQIIAAAGFNMECIKSRPRPGHPFEYYFYTELVGSPNEEAAQSLLNSLEAVCRGVRLLGIYTR